MIPVLLQINKFQYQFNLSNQKNMSNRMRVEATIMESVSSAIAGNQFRVEDFETITVRVTTNGSGNMVLKCQGAVHSLNEDKSLGLIAFGSAKSGSNPWEHVNMINLEDGSSVDGSTGVTLGANESRLFQVNVDGLDLVNFIVSTYTAGTVSVKAVGYTKS